MVEIGILQFHWAVNADETGFSLVSDLCFLSFPLPVSISMFHWVSSFPLACRTGGWEKSGQFEDMIFPSRSLILSLAVSALQSPLSTLITYINLSNKKTALDFPVSGLYGVKECPGLCTSVCSAQTQVNSQREWWLLGSCITSNSFFVQQIREKQVCSACLLWMMALTRKEEKMTSKKTCAFVCVLKDKWSRGEGIDRKIGHGWMVWNK